jgi:serine/threonine-protein phosphatase 2A activator
MNFICMLACLSRLHQPSSSTTVHAVEQPDQPVTRERIQSMALVSLIFARYLRLCRRLQRTYWLEPAGSRGVWGLDDHFFLPFYLGASQLRQHRHLRPKSIRSAEVLEGFSHDYLYLEAVKAIQEIKLASFAEHSPMLNDISEVKTWDKVPKI